MKVMQADHLTPDKVQHMIEEQFVISKGNLIHIEQFNTMSENFSEQLREFKQEIQEQLMKNAAGGGGIFQETAQSSLMHQPI